MSWNSKTPKLCDTQKNRGYRRRVAVSRRFVSPKMGISFSFMKSSLKRRLAMVMRKRRYVYFRMIEEIEGSDISSDEEESFETQTHWHVKGHWTNVVEWIRENVDAVAEIPNRTGLQIICFRLRIPNNILPGVFLETKESVQYVNVVSNWIALACDYKNMVVEVCKSVTIRKRGRPV